MKVMIGSIILLFIIGFGVWLMLSPLFQKIGRGASKIKKTLEDDTDERTTNEKE
ncbi:hypothetical protein OZL92_17990 [Bacillus sonorensis]|uniref:Uncharacterized protein n=2 Tax=Bacillus sonorensis TaxID=119858 RepID=M5PEI6_9BACI|nr:MULTISPECIES: hypothetical protein [Bacillus]TWK84242.1 hypothetical protein CHCC20335_4310 [Bacillus paralicheniformis]ASB89132.1 hypothetical protein S101395_02625 [Bacillus sonorensis]EME75640.1 hypothetical protein BSONL12_04978 [Bacillus sonorensis L12]MCF7618475.1 hypothetical protein [Bacillus sonorensis]MCY7859452.1 hypothetical protein [Bacillus sonorensis]